MASLRLACRPPSLRSRLLMASPALRRPACKWSLLLWNTRPAAW